MPNCTCTSFMSSAILQILSTNKYPQLQRKMLWNKEKINCICLEWTGTNLRLINTCYLSTGPPPLSMSRYWVHHHWVVVPLFLRTMEGRDHLHYSLIQILQTFCIHQGVMVGFATSQSMLCSALCIFVKLWNNSWLWICKIVFHHQPLNTFKHLSTHVKPPSNIKIFTGKISFEKKRIVVLTYNLETQVEMKTFVRQQRPVMSFNLTLWNIQHCFSEHWE